MTGWHFFLEICQPKTIGILLGKEQLNNRNLTIKTHIK